MRNRTYILSLVSILSVFLLCHVSHAGSLVKAQYFTGTTTHFSPIFVAEQKGYFKEFGLDMEVKIFSSGLAATEAFRAGKGDFLCSGDWPAPKVWERGEGIGIAPYAYFDKISCVVANKGLTKPADLKGKKVATLIGSSAEYFAWLYLAAGGLTFNDVQMKKLSPADMVYAIDKEDIDAFIIWEPFCTQSATKISKGKVDIMSYGTGYFTEWMVTHVSPSFAKQNKSAVTGALKALNKANALFKSNRDEFDSIVSKRVKTDLPMIQDLHSRMNFDIKFSKVFRADMEKMAKFQIDKEILSKPINWDASFDKSFLKSVDPSLVEE